MKMINVRNYSLAVLAALSVSASAYAQGTSAAELDQELDAELGSIQTVAPAQKSTAVVTQTIVVPQPAAVEVQKQPVTVVEATPLSVSNAEGMRKSRQEEEMKTESKIVEKLESSRLEDEKRRADVLFGNKFQALEQKPVVVEAQPVVVQPAVVAPVQVAPAVVAQPQVVPSSQVAPQVIIEDKNSLTREEVREEMRAVLDEDKEADLTGNMFESKYMAITAGMVSYPTLTESIRAGYSLGAAIGTSYDNLLVEVGFNYGQSEMWAYYPVNSGWGYQNGVSEFRMNQYQGYLASKFQFMNGVIRPNVGGILAYTYRTYVTNSIAMDDRGVWVPEGTQFGTSNAVDLGLTAGVDFAVSKTISLGADLKYMLFNVMNSANGNRSPGYKTAERENHFIFGAAARFNF